MESAIILPVYNHLDYTRITLSELSGLIHDISDHKFHIVLVDDGSVDGTDEWVRVNYPEAIVLKGSGSLWWSGAVNLGVRYALENTKTEYIILWNNDIHTDRLYFQHLLKILPEVPPGTIVGSKIFVAEQPDVIWSMGGFFNPKNGQYGMYGYFEKDAPEYDSIRTVDWLTGMGTVIPRKAIEEIGYWDNNNYPQYHGDSDFTYRAKLKGYHLMVYPALKMYNSIKNSGIEHEGKFKNLFRLLTDIRSKSNLKKNFRFYRSYATSIRAYMPLLWHYFQIIGGFFKWKLLNVFGLRKKKINS